MKFVDEYSVFSRLKRLLDGYYLHGQASFSVHLFSDGRYQCKLECHDGTVSRFGDSLDEAVCAMESSIAEAAMSSPQSLSRLCTNGK